MEKIEEEISHPYRFLKVNLTIQSKKGVSSIVIEFPMVFKDGRFLIDEWVLRYLEVNIPMN